MNQTAQYIKDIVKLKEEIRNCHKCSLCDDSNNKATFARSGRNIKIPVELMVVGEASGREEALEGKPFVGRAGKMLDQWLKALNVENVIITNVVKNRPPDNRVPTDEEIKACSPYLIEQIRIFKPKRILVVGNTAYRFLYGAKSERIAISKAIEEQIKNKSSGKYIL